MIGALALISAGDLAWWRGDRGTASADWRAALDDPGPGPAGRAAEAMARVRLLQIDGSVGPFVHEARLDRALAECPTSEPWCAIAAADAALFMPAFTGADPSQVPALLAGCPLVGPAAARVAIATGSEAVLATLPPDALDGMGHGILATHRLRPPAPGTWVLGIGVGGAPGAGVGLSVRFVHPDLAWKAHRLELLVGADTRGGALFDATLATHTRPSFSTGLTLARTVADVWMDGAPLGYTLDTGRVGVGVTPRWGDLALTVGGSVRADALEGAEGATTDPLALTAGPSAGLSYGAAAASWLHVGVDTGFGSYTHAAVTAEVRLHPRVAGGTLALRTAVTNVPTESPFYRLPTAGGADLLRGAPAGRYRDHTVFAGQIEYRHVVYGPLFAAGFVDTAHAQGWHATAGGGIRIVLPPDKLNVTRLDVGFGPGTWGVVAAWGEAF